MKQALFVISLLFSFSTFGQTIKGYVVNTANEPIIGAQVMESNYRNGTTTNIDGSFILDLNDPNSTVIFSFVGYQTDSLLLAHGEMSQVVLKTDDQAYGLDFKSTLSDYRVLLIAIWAIICVWLVIRTFRGVASA